MLAAIDRISPTRRPTGRAAMKQRWAELGFLHWKMPAAKLAALVPPALTIDTFDGTAWVGLIPFTMTGVRPAWSPPIPGISRFHEVNVRTYVHKNGRDPGVWFFSLDAGSSLAVRAARAFWRLPYHRATMSLHRGSDGTVSYASARRWPPPVPAHCRVIYRPDGPAAPARLGTLEHFLAERYFLYTQGRTGALLRGQVHHMPYPLQRAVAAELDETMLAAAGITRPAELPLVHYANEVRVDVFPLREV